MKSEVPSMLTHVADIGFARLFNSLLKPLATLDPVVALVLSSYDWVPCTSLRPVFTRLIGEYSVMIQNLSGCGSKGSFEIQIQNRYIIIISQMVILLE